MYLFSNNSKTVNPDLIMSEWKHCSEKAKNCQRIETVEDLSKTLFYTLNYSSANGVSDKKKEKINNLKNIPSGAQMVRMPRSFKEPPIKYITQNEYNSMSYNADNAFQETNISFIDGGEYSSAFYKKAL